MKETIFRALKACMQLQGFSPSTSLVKPVRLIPKHYLKLLLLYDERVAQNPEFWMP